VILRDDRHRIAKFCQPLETLRRIHSHRDFTLKIRASRETEIFMSRPRITIDAAIIAAATWIQAVVSKPTRGERYVSMTIEIFNNAFKNATKGNPGTLQNSHDGSSWFTLLSQIFS
jgi:hypothetical protein